MRILLMTAVLAAATTAAFAQSQEPPAPPPGANVPDWALPQSAKHRQVPPPPGFHRPPVTFSDTIGAFDAQTDVGGPLVPGHATYDATTGTYTIISAGYNIWYTRDEFRFLWKKMTGDVSLAASVEWPNLDDFHDRKVVLAIRESLDDDSRQIVVGQHGNGMVHIAWRGEKGGMTRDVEFHAKRQPNNAAGEKGMQALHPKRIGIEKSGDQVQLWVSWQGEPLHPEGTPVTFPMQGPVYVGIGFTSHLPATALTAQVKNVMLENRAGAVK